MRTSKQRPGNEASYGGGPAPCVSMVPTPPGIYLRKYGEIIGRAGVNPPSRRVKLMFLCIPFITVLQLKQRKSAGPAEITPEHLVYSGPILKLSLRKFSTALLLSRPSLPVLQCPNLKRKGQKTTPYCKLQRHLNYLHQWKGFWIYCAAENDPNPKWEGHTSLYPNNSPEGHFICKLD